MAGIAYPGKVCNVFKQGETGEARHQINVNCVCHGATAILLLAEITSGEKGTKIIEALVRTVSFSRSGKPEGIAGAVAILASDKDPFITGQALSVSGGLAMGCKQFGVGRGDPAGRPRGVLA